MHTAGEPLRIILSAPFLPQGADILARRRDTERRLGPIPRELMFEPRGHQDMYGAIITPAVGEGASFGVLFTHNDGYSTMCGHAIIALGKAVVELGWVEAVEPETAILGIAEARLRIKPAARSYVAGCASTYSDDLANVSRVRIHPEEHAAVLSN
jgi:trans-L-3-hydroxyproline dehydratase